MNYQRHVIDIAGTPQPWMGVMEGIEQGMEVEEE
jgi:hypothetical protein